MTNAMTEKNFVLPGDTVGYADGVYEGGKGTYTRCSQIISCRAGVMTLREVGNNKFVIDIERDDVNLVPYVGAVVTCKVTGINTRICRCVIMAVGGVPVQGQFRAIVRKEDIRATQRDQAEVASSFRPGDILQARVTNLGDAQSYVLTTAETGLGVVLARGPEEDGARPLVPVSWTEMACPWTGKKYPRKVARVSTEFIESIVMV